METARAENIAHVNQRLPARLTETLFKLAKKYRAKGVHLFIFGSFANGNDKQTSDLDLGVLWEKEPSDRIFNKLYRDVQQLPTVRKIDLVNIASVDEVFKENVLENAIFLSQMRKPNEKRHLA